MNVSERSLVLERVGVTFENWAYGRPAANAEPGIRPGGGRLLLEKDVSLFQKAMDGIFSQVVLALKAYQKYAGFLHNDMHTQNVCLIDAREPTNMRIPEGGTFSLPVDVPLIKIIDLADGQIECREFRLSRGRDTAFVNGLTNSFDLFRFSTSLLPERPGVPGIRKHLSPELRACVLKIAYPPRWRFAELWFLRNPNAVSFPYLHEFPTPLSLVREALDAAASRNSPLKRFLKNDASPAYVETEDAGWTYATSDEKKKFERRERAYPVAPYSPIRRPKLMNVSVAVSLAAVSGEVLNLWTYRLSTRYEKAEKEKGTGEALRCYGDCDEPLKKMVMRTVALLFQRGARAFFEKYAAETTSSGSADHVFWACLLKASGGETWTFIEQPVLEKHVAPVRRLADTMDDKDFDDDAKTPIERDRSLHEAPLTRCFDHVRWATNPLFFKLHSEAALEL